VTVVGKFLVTLWHWCVHLVKVPAWLVIVLSLYVSVSLIRTYLRRRSRTRQQNTQPAQRTSNWRDYTCDVFHEIVWRWEYGNRGQLIQFVPFCFKCDTQIHPQIGHIGPFGEKTDYHCDHCENRVLLDGSHEHVVDRISRQIQRKLRSPTEEWKTAIKAHASRR
jgi:hypothetical protein